MSVVDPFFFAIQKDNETQLQTNLFHTLKTSYVQKTTDLPSVLQIIKRGDYKVQILEARQYVKGHDVYDRIKRGIPTFSPNGTFNKIRARRYFQASSGMVYIDIDQPIEPTVLHEIPWVYACWKSFGGINYGLLASVSGLTKETFLPSWLYLEDYFKKINITIDKQAKDITRQCVLSYDPDLYINQHHTQLVIPWEDIKTTTTTILSQTYPVDTTLSTDNQYKLNYQTTLADYNNQDYVVISDGKEFRNTYLPRNIYEGERHKWISSFASSMLFNNPAIT